MFTVATVIYPPLTPPLATPGGSLPLPPQPHTSSHLQARKSSPRHPTSSVLSSRSSLVESSNRELSGRTQESQQRPPSPTTVPRLEPPSSMEVVAPPPRPRLSRPRHRHLLIRATTSSQTTPKRASKDLPPPLLTRVLSLADLAPGQLA